MEVRAAGEGIRTSKEASQDMDDLEVKVGKIEQPSGLLTVEILGLMEVCQVLVICKDLDGEEGTVEIMPPGF